ncbi:MAG: prepilin-type N-terminal cleavage/methylation domain-containing protein [Planctomycetota bacterium]|nr:prepilin-type N-terminal cleavage/methylation domain-containing protein [Planctomycetota bacterium]
MRDGSENSVNGRRRCHGHRLDSSRATLRSFARGFSLLELMIVLAVTVVLTSMMLPTMSRLRESAYRTICSSNQRQQGLALFMYAGDNNEKLPSSSALEGVKKNPQELMRAYIPETQQWDGWGILFQFQYCSAVECYYCPSHHGDHPMERYYSDWIRPTGIPIYTNYHYAGNIEWQSNKPRNLHGGKEQVLATDGLRTTSDINHNGDGMNMLYGDGSVRWLEGAEKVFELVPSGIISTPEEAARYWELWEVLEVK